MQLIVEKIKFHWNSILVPPNPNNLGSCKAFGLLFNISVISAQAEVRLKSDSEAGRVAVTREPEDRE